MSARSRQRTSARYALICAADGPAYRDGIPSFSILARAAASNSSSVCPSAAAITAAYFRRPSSSLQPGTSSITSSRSVHSSVRGAGTVTSRGAKPWRRMFAPTSRRLAASCR